MNAPWEFKYTTHSGQYRSCLRINGVPLLPPVLTQECREEMKYYKYLAREVENRIKLLKPIVADSDSDSSDKTISPQILETSKKHYSNSDKEHDDRNGNSPFKPVKLKYDNTLSHDTADGTQSTEFMFSDDNSDTGTGKKEIELDIDVPERDYELAPKIHGRKENELLKREQVKRHVNDQKICCSKKYVNIVPAACPVTDFSIKRKSNACKSFTGSLNDIHRECLQDIQNTAKLIRQRSYTVLTPSPQLLAHLEVQSISTGVAVSSISMSESQCRMNSPKKRRGWDLESAKIKWSNMAMELNKAQALTRKVACQKPNTVPRTLQKDNPRKNSTNSPTAPKQNGVTSGKLQTPTPVRNSSTRTGVVTNPRSLPDSDNHHHISTAIDPIKPNHMKVEPHSRVPSENNDPASCVRELYEKIQQQQLLQMTNLIEKQKKEQALLQQLFEEQNSVLYKQLKNICPKTPLAVKKAWEETDNTAQSNSGPVSLSQVINDKSQPKHSNVQDAVSSTLNESKNYINYCDDILKKSRDISHGLKQGTPASSPALSKNLANATNQHVQRNNNNCKQYQSPYTRNKPKLSVNNDTSSPSDKEYDEPILTDRTNDTLADVNFTFTDDSANGHSNENNTCVLKNDGKSVRHHTNEPVNGKWNGDQHDKGKHESVRTSPNLVQMARQLTAASNRKAAKKLFENPPTPRQREAATKIVAFAKGYLVRRLLRTERVQETVQTIRDALLCALQLHQDREGIRGADVDLHRRLIQQITAACYTLHETFVSSSPAERCAVIAADRWRRKFLKTRLPTPPYKKPSRPTDIMSQSHSGAFPVLEPNQAPASMTQSYYETFSDKSPLRRPRLMSAERCRRPWR